MTSPKKSNSSNKNNHSGHYISVNTSGGAQRRIRTPSINDILLGRGGGINSHEGNRIFREWVRDRKEDYNLAPNKFEKMQVAKDVMTQVRAQGGRFLQKLSGSGDPGFWIEVDELRALAKTSQALREGAPQIRAAHQPSPQTSTAKRKRSSRTQKQNSAPSQSGEITSSTSEWPQTVPGVSPELSSTSAPLVVPVMDEASKQQAIEELREHLEEAKEQHSRPATQTTMYRPLMSNKDFREQHKQALPIEKVDQSPASPSNTSKRPRLVIEENLEETPSLTSIPTLPHELPPWRLLDADFPKKTVPPPPSVPQRQKLDNRSHSLAVSGDDSATQGLSEDFVNPFEDETDAVQMANQAASKGITSAPLSSTPSSLVRNVSSEQGREEYRQIGYLYEWNHNDDSCSGRHQTNPEPSTDFYEELRQVMDVVHPDLTTMTAAPHEECKGDPLHWDYHHDDEDNDGSNMPTLLMPFRPSILSRRYGSSNSLQHHKNKSGGSSSNQSGSNGRSVSPHEGDVMGPAQQ